MGRESSKPIDSRESSKLIDSLVVAGWLASPDGDKVSGDPSPISFLFS